MIRVLYIPGDIWVYREACMEVGAETRPGRGRDARDIRRRRRQRESLVVGPIAVVSVCGASTVWRGWGDSTTTNDDDENIGLDVATRM